MKGGPFKLNLYPREYFDTNPYHDEGPFPPPKRPPEKIPIPHPFKPSSPAKKVCLLIVDFSRNIYCRYFCLAKKTGYV